MGRKSTDLEEKSLEARSLSVLMVREGGGANNQPITGGPGGGGGRAVVKCDSGPRPLVFEYPGFRQSLAV